MTMLRRIFAMAGIESALLFRSRATFTLIILVPAIQMLLFGNAVRPGHASVSVAVAASAPADARNVVHELEHEKGFVAIVGRFKPGEAAAAVREGRALMGVELSPQPPSAQSKLVRVVIDGTDASRAASAAAAIEAIFWRGRAERADPFGQGPTLQIDRLYNPDSRADWTFLPSLIGVTVMIAMIMLGSLSVARERETGTWEGLRTLPLARGEILIGKALPHVAIGTAQGLLVLGGGIALFDLPVRGSVGSLIALLPLFAAAHFLIGFLISTRASTQLAALQGAVAIYLPVMLLSGFLYPFDTLPDWAQSIGNSFPLTYWIGAAHGALLQGRDTREVLAFGIPMLAFIVAGLAVALLARPPRFD